MPVPGRHTQGSGDEREEGRQHGDDGDEGDDRALVRVGDRGGVQQVGDVDAGDSDELGNDQERDEDQGDDELAGPAPSGLEVGEVGQLEGEAGVGSGHHLVEVEDVEAPSVTTRSPPPFLSW